MLFSTFIVNRIPISIFVASAMATIVDHTMATKGVSRWRPLLNPIPVEIVFGVKNYLYVIISQNDVYLEDKIAEINRSILTLSVR